MLIKPKNIMLVTILFIVVYILSELNSILYGKIKNNPVNNNSIVSISGTVRYDDSLIISQGYVKALMLDSVSYAVVVVDSAGIQFNGNYSMQITPPPQQVYIMAYPSSEDSFIPTYYPNRINWQQAIRVSLDSNQSNINIFASRIPLSSNNGVIYGYINGNQSSQLSLKDAIIYAQTGNIYRGFSISFQNGYYRITKLPFGNYMLYTDRIGYNGQLVNIAFNADSLRVDFTLIKIPIGIKEIHGRIPENFNLWQNYPNPFNPSTKIRFDIPIRGMVYLTVYDITGRVVEFLIRQELKEGSYETEFNASDLPSGIYFYKLSAKGYSDSKKMIVLK